MQTPQECTATRTWPGPGSGSERSSRRNVLSPVQTIARDCVIDATLPPTQEPLEQTNGPSCEAAYLRHPPHLDGVNLTGARLAIASNSQTEAVRPAIKKPLAPGA